MLDRRLAKPTAIDADQVAIDVLGYIAGEPDLKARWTWTSKLGGTSVATCAIVILDRAR